MKRIFFLIIAAICFISCGCTHALTQEETTYNTTEAVRELTGLECVPDLVFKGAYWGQMFDGWFPDQWVTFDLKDSLLSDSECEAVMDAARNGDSFFWDYVDLPENAIAEYEGLKITSQDTIHFELVFFADKVKLAYEQYHWAPNFADECNVSSFPKYDLLGHKMFRVGPDGTDVYCIQFTDDYTPLIKELKKKGWNVKVKTATIEITDPNNEPSEEDRFGAADIADGVVLIIDKTTNKAIITTAWS